MAGRIVLFGATGYTGRLVAGELAAQGVPALLAGRSLSRLEDLASELSGDFDLAEATVDDPAGLSALLGRRDILLSTVGPFLKLGGAAVTAAIDSRAGYIDSAGEPAFIRRVFESYGPDAEAAGVVLLPAFGYDFVPGHVAAGLAIERAGPDATQVDVGYFSSGGGWSAGTMASLAGAARTPQFAYRDGRLVTERGAARTATFTVRGGRAPALSMGGSEHLSLPTVYPQLDTIGTYLGWFGALTPLMPYLGRAQSLMQRLPGAASAMDRVVAHMPGGKQGTGPDAEERARTRSTILAVARNPDGDELAKVRLAGVDGYTLTARLMVWAALQLQRGERPQPGARGPLEAFDLRTLVAALDDAGLQRKRS